MAANSKVRHIVDRQSSFFTIGIIATEIEGESESLPIPAGAQLADVDPISLPDIDFDNGKPLPCDSYSVLSSLFSDDPTNLHRHARHNAQEAISLAKQRAQQFDTQAALERKTNEALKLAKAQSHIYENAAQDETPAAPPLVDCMYCFALIHICSH